MVNTFVVVDCKDRKNVLVTNSARKAKDRLYVGAKIEVWNSNGVHMETIYSRNIGKINKYISLQKQFIGEKQRKAEQRNRRKNNEL